VDPDVLMRFLLDGLHGAMLPLFHDGQQRRRVQADLNEIIRRVLAPPAAGRAPGVR
jgi:hypothetical protein